MNQVKATQVAICIFVPQDKANVGQYSAEVQALYQMFGNAIVTLRQRHGSDVPVYLDFCPTTTPSNVAVLEQNGGSVLNLPAVQLYAKYNDGTAGQYFLKKGITDAFGSLSVTESQALAYTEALLYHLSPTPQTLLCKILPPLCSLGWYIWLGAAAYTTYQTTQARNVGKWIWGAAAALTWNEFVQRGGLKELVNKIDK